MSPGYEKAPNPDTSPKPSMQVSELALDIIEARMHPSGLGHERQRGANINAERDSQWVMLAGYHKCTHGGAMDSIVPIMTIGIATPSHCAPPMV